MKYNKTNKWEGKRNGMLTALTSLGTAKSDSGRTYSIWLFKCDCGNEKILCPHDVFKKRKKESVKGTLSCGCITKQLMSENKRKPDGEAALNNLYASYKLNCAEGRGHVFELTLKEFKEITSSNCFYCNKQPSQKKNSKISFYMYNGIDRVNNNLGYTTDNCVAACKDCNSLKSGVTVEIAKKMLEFLGVIKNES